MLLFNLLQLCDLYENDSIFDKFECCLSGDGLRVATGSYRFPLISVICGSVVMWIVGPHLNHFISCDTVIYSVFLAVPGEVLRLQLWKPVKTQ